MIRTLLLSATLAAAPLTSFAADWALDKAHTIVAFEVEHLGFSKTQGVFRTVDAEIAFDAENIEATEVSVTIDAGSIDTFWEARDTHVKGEDFLDIGNHPEITFISTGVTKTGDTTAEVAGDLTIKGVTKPVVFAAYLNKIGPNPFDDTKQVAGFRLTGEIDRTEFGVDYGAPAIGTVIPITIDMEIGAPAS